MTGNTHLDPTDGVTIRFNPFLLTFQAEANGGTDTSIACALDCSLLADLCYLPMPDDLSLLAPPLPIPNRTVKQQHADDSAGYTARK